MGLRHSRSIISVLLSVCVCVCEAPEYTSLKQSVGIYDCSSATLLIFWVEVCDVNCIGYADVNKVGSAFLFSTMHTSKKTCMDTNSFLRCRGCRLLPILLFGLWNGSCGAVVNWCWLRKNWQHTLTLQYFNLIWLHRGKKRKGLRKVNTFVLVLFGTMQHNTLCTDLPKVVQNFALLCYERWTAIPMSAVILGKIEQLVFSVVYANIPL